MAVDLNRIAAAAIETLLDEGERARDRHEDGSHRLPVIGALALGVGIGVAARAAYRRVRRLDLERVAASVEERLER